MAEDPILEELRKLNETVSSMLTVIRATTFAQLRQTIRLEFDDASSDGRSNALKRRIYALCDGNNSSRDIERLMNGVVKQRTIVRHQEQWRNQGLALAVGGHAKTKALFDLEDFGLEVPANEMATIATPEPTQGEGE